MGYVKEDTPIHKKLKSVKRAASRPYEAWDYGQFFIGFVTVGTTDVFKNLRYRWPCVGDVANILESGYDVYKYMHLYVRTEDTADDNSFLLANSVTRALTGVQVGLDWKCAEKEIN